MGRFMAWFIGWNMVLEYLVSAATVSVGWSGYFVSLLAQFGIHIPAELTNAPLAPIGGTGLSDLHWTHALMNVPAMALIGFLSIILIVGVRESATFNGLMVLIKTSVVVLVIAFGLSYVHFSNLQPFIPAYQGPGKFGWSGILAASGMIFFAYIGFEAVSVAATEARNPRRDLPIGILGSLGICTVLYMLMALVLTGITDWRTLDVPNPVSFAVAKIPDLKWLEGPVNVGALVGLASVTFVSLYGQSRVFYSMARDGFLPPAFSAIHPRFRTPHLGTIITGLVAALLAAAFPFDILAELVSVGTLLAFIAVCAGILILRLTAPRANRRFRIPYVWFVAPAGLVICMVMMVSKFISSPDTLTRLVFWTVIGLVIYFVYGVWHAAPSKWKVANEAG
jgi:APA family basic amino acid/polyamine antiporter